MQKKKKPQLNNRKLDHIRIVQEEQVEPRPSSFDGYNWPYKTFPELDFEDIDTTSSFSDFDLSFPFLISSMTGGPEKGLIINRNLAEAAEEVGVGLGLGSMRVILRKPESLKSFDVKKYCPSVPLFANFGAIQLNYGYGASDINKIIDSVNADGIFLHINPLQEIIQPEGDTKWKGLLDKLAQIIPKIEKPVVVKEVGHGIDFESAKTLKKIGVDWVDVSGLGGTSWSWVEAYRREDTIGHVFKDIGIPTDQAIISNSRIKDLKLIAGGGIRNGLHIAKALALGAHIATAAKPLLNAALESPESCIKVLEQLKLELKIAMFAAGCKNISSLAQLKLTKNK